MDIYKILNTLNSLEEGSMEQATHKPTGPKFVGKMKGTDPAGARYNKLVGSCEESIDQNLEEELMAEWNAIMELGANNPAQGGTANAMGGGTGGTSTPSPTDQQNLAKKINNTQQNLNKLKSAGVNVPASTSQAVQTAIKATDTPNAQPNQTDKKVGMGLAQELEKALSTGNPSQVGQIATALKQIKTGQGQQ